MLFSVRIEHEGSFFVAAFQLGHICRSRFQTAFYIAPVADHDQDSVVFRTLLHPYHSAENKSSVYFKRTFGPGAVRKFHEFAYFLQELIAKGDTLKGHTYYRSGIFFLPRPVFAFIRRAAQQLPRFFASEPVTDSLEKPDLACFRFYCHHKPYRLKIGHIVSFTVYCNGDCLFIKVDADGNIVAAVFFFQFQLPFRIKTAVVFIHRSMKRILISAYGDKGVARPDVRVADPDVGKITGAHGVIVSQHVVGQYDYIAFSDGSRAVALALWEHESEFFLGYVAVPGYASVFFHIYYPKPHPVSDIGESNRGF